MSDSQQPQTPLARLEQLERQIASKVEEVVQGLRQEIGDGVRNAGEEIQRLLDAVREEKEESASEPAPAPAPSGPDLGDLVAAVARVDGQSGQADVIKTLLEESAPYASRAVFFLVRQNQIRAWSSRGFGSGSGRVEGLQATTDQAPWNSVPGDASTILDAEQTAAFGKAFGSSSGADAVWIPFVLRGQLAGALYIDRLEGDAPLDAAALQLLTHCAATSLETAVSNPNVSATLELRGKLPEVIAEEHTIAVDEDEAPEVEGVAAETEPEEAEAEDVEAEADDEEATEETTDETTAETTEETTAETTDEVEDYEEEPEEPTDVSGDEAEEADDGYVSADDAAAAVTARAAELPEVKVSEVSAPEVTVPEVTVPEVTAPEEPAEELTEPPDFEMVEDTVPESEPDLEVEPAASDELPAEALAEPPEVPDLEVGEPEPTPDFEVAEAPEVPEVELGEPEAAPSFETEPPDVPEVELADEVGDDDIVLEAEAEPPLDEDADLWEADDDEPTAPGEAEEDDGDASVVTQPAVPVPAAPEPSAPEPTTPAGLAGNETVRIDTANLPQPSAPPPVAPKPAPEPAAPQPDAVQYPSSFAEPPAPVQAPPPSFAEPEAPSEPDEPSPSEVAPPPDMAAQPSSQVTPPADASPTSQVSPPPEPPASSTEVRPPTDLEGPGLAFAAPTPAQAEREMDDAEEALHEEARRLARLLVSEIKLYNEEIIEEGRRTGNIYERLKDDIDRSRQMYEERIDPRLADQEDYFHQELVQRLAGGDESLLGV